MSRYVTTKAFKETALCGRRLVIHYGEELEERDGILYWQDNAVCLSESENGFLHFSWNGDGKGLDRGALTYAIAYGDNGRSHAFSNAENQLMRVKWGRYLRSLSDANIVNADFFRAPIEILMQIAADLHFVQRKGRYYYRGMGPEKKAGGIEDVRNYIGGDGSLENGQAGIYYS